MYRAKSSSSTAAKAQPVYASCVWAPLVAHAIALGIATILSACGGGQALGDAAETAEMVTATSESATASPDWARGASLSVAALADAERQAVAADAARSSVSLDELPAGQIAAKSAYASGAVARKAAAVRIPVYRFYNGSTGAHFFTTSTTERDNVVTTLSPPFSLEGEACSVASDFSPGLSPIHRF